MSNNVKLDINEAEINKKLQIISGDSNLDDFEMMNKILQNDPMSIPHKIIHPSPGACVKSWLENDEKVFVNICHSPEVPEAEDISEERLMKIMVDDAPSFIIPMAIGVERMEKDKEGIERSTFDVVLNTKYFEKCMIKKLFWKFTISIILESINDKYKKNIVTSKHVVLQNRKMLGKLQTFKIEDRPVKKPPNHRPLIEELDSNETKDFKNSSVRKDSKASTHVIAKYKNQLIGLFNVPMADAENIQVDISDNRIIVEVPESNYLVHTFLPNYIDTQKTTAYLDNALQVLRLNMPLQTLA